MHCKAFLTQRTVPQIPPPLHPLASLSPPLLVGGGDTLAGRRGVRGVPILTRGQTLWYSMYFVNGTQDTKHAMNVVFSRALGHRYVDLGGLESAIKERESPINVL